VREIRNSEPYLPEDISIWQVIGQLSDALYVSSLFTGEIVCLNSACKAVTGFGRDELQSMGMDQVRQRIHPQDREQYMARIRALESEQESQTIQYRWQRKDGSYSWIQDSCSLLHDEQGRPQALVGTWRDISEQKATQQRLQQASQRLERVIRFSLDGIEQVNVKTNTFDVISPSMERLTGFTREELLAMGPDGKAARVHPDHQQAYRDYMTRVIEQPDQVRPPLEYLWQKKDGEWRWFSDSQRAARDEEGNIRMVSVLRDMTDNKRAEEELRESEERLKNLNEVLEQRVRERTLRLRGMVLEMTRVEERERRRLSQLLHDHLQQLLAAARMQINMLQGQIQDKSHAQALEQVDNLLEESIAESRSLTAELSPPMLYSSGLAPALQWLAENMRQHYGLQVNLDIEDLGKQVSEEMRVGLFQAARELLFNVVKHAGVDRAGLSLHRPDGNVVQMQISDEGKGMDVSQAEQQDGHYGLFSIRERIEALDGSVEIDSAPGQGTRITLTAPLRLSETEQQPTAPPEKEEEAERKPVRVLLADDHDIVRQGLARLLEEEPDIELVAEANSGRAAVELAQSTHPDVVLMDVSMPDMDGVEATKQILAAQPDTWVIGLSMYEQDAMIAKMRQVGAGDYVAKGGDPAELIEAVRRGARRETRRPEPQP
jgi:PAS domain S-box-containing protein